MGWLVTLGVLTLLAILPLGVSIVYDSGGAVVRLILGPVKLTLIPRPPKEKKPPKKEKPKKTEPSIPDGSRDPAPKKPKEPEEKKRKSGGKLTDFLPLVRTVLDFLSDFRRKLRVNNLELKLVMAADDPCDLAVSYGRAWAAVGNLMPRLERWLVIKKRNIEVECDFEATETLVTARLDLTITLGRVLAAVAVFAFRALKQLLKILKKRKGGAGNEQKSSQHDAGHDCENPRTGGCQ